MPNPIFFYSFNFVNVSTILLFVTIAKNLDIIFNGFLSPVSYIQSVTKLYFFYTNPPGPCFS